MLSIVYPPNVLPRVAKRKAVREFEEIANLLYPIEQKFLIGIFETKYSYSEVYEAYLREWRIMMDKIKRMKKDFIEVEEDYFTRNFQPIEFFNR